MIKTLYEQNTKLPCTSLSCTANTQRCLGRLKHNLKLPCTSKSQSKLVRPKHNVTLHGHKFALLIQNTQLPYSFKTTLTKTTTTQNCLDALNDHNTMLPCPSNTKSFLRRPKHSFLVRPKDKVTLQVQITVVFHVHRTKLPCT